MSNLLFIALFTVGFLLIGLTIVTDGRTLCYLGLHWWNKWSEPYDVPSEWNKRQVHSCARCGIIKTRAIK